MWYYSKEIRIVFFSLVIGLFLIPVFLPGFSQTDEESFKELSEEDLMLIEEYLDQAQTLFEQRFTESTIFHYDKVLAIDSLNIDALNGKAFVLDFVGSHEEAISYYEEVLLIDSKNNDSLLGKALALDNLSKPEETILYFDKVLETEEILQPIQDITDKDLEFLQVTFELAQELFEGGHYNESISYYNLVLQFIPSDIDALIGKAIALGSIGNHEEAILFYDKVLAIDSSDIDALFGRAVLLESLGREEESLSNLEKIETIILPKVEFRVPPEETVNQTGVEDTAESDQTLFVIVGVLIVILISIILIYLIVKRRKSLPSAETPQ